MLSIAFYYSSFSTDWHLRCTQGLCTEYVWQEWCALMNVPSVLISNTWVLLAKPWLKWSIGNYLPIPWTWLTKARNVLQINSYECMGIKPLVLGKGGATTHRLQGVSPKIFGRSLTVQEQLYIQTMSKWKKKGCCYSCSLWQFEVISPSSSGYNWKNNPYRSSSICA